MKSQLVFEKNKLLDGECCKEQNTTKWTDSSKKILVIGNALVNSLPFFFCDFAAIFFSFFWNHMNSLCIHQNFSLISPAKTKRCKFSFVFVWEELLSNLAISIVPIDWTIEFQFLYKFYIVFVILSGGKIS